MNDHPFVSASGKLSRAWNGPCKSCSLPKNDPIHGISRTAKVTIAVVPTQTLGKYRVEVRDTGTDALLDYADAVAPNVTVTRNRLCEYWSERAASVVSLPLPKGAC